MFLAFFGGDDGESVTFFFPSGDLVQETRARLGLDLETLLRDERIVGIRAMVGKALSVPSEFGGGFGEQRGGFVEVAQAEV